ncbi:DUF1134 domain-containing protein [Phreatobacter sp. AB_2022a]|uniref:DUF1134 domain-containing protein n=1 Tax=Phreatobacter sp. AB_2022a TaxID=3003134 RepID=UPI0022875878|nr:DUF1134 domain-containing protein [Phreatobacter sp. AB_2022a]MCZ0738077.1 DUF1134 domain-containing protein [Phreatobacter sp. AB_2022a]
MRKLEKFDRRTILAGLSASALVGLDRQAFAQRSFQSETPQTYSGNEVIAAGHRFFGGAARGLANLVERATQQWGHPSAYILGQEGGGAFFAGLRYGEGMLYTKSGADAKVFWQGPSLGFDFGGDGARTMMLGYRVRSPEDLYRRFGGIDGSAYLVGGLGMTALAADNMMVVPIRTGVGARLGVSGGYLKFTPSATWNPF